MPAILQSDYSWDDLRVFLALWRARTLSAAGSRLGVNASTVGRRVDALEAALGARLFDRTPDGVLPTAAAELLLTHAERVEEAAIGLAGEVSGFESAPEGTVRLTAPPAVAEDLIAPSLPRLRKKYPALVLELDASVSYADLTRREADVAVRLKRPTSGDLTSVRLAEDPSVIVAAAPLVASLGALRALDETAWLAWDASLRHLPDARWVDKHVPQCAVVLRTNSIGALVTAAEHGTGTLLLSRAHARARKLSLVRLTKRLRESLSPMPLTSLWLVGHQSLRRVPRIAAVWDFLLEEVKRGGLASAP